MEIRQITAEEARPLRARILRPGLPVEQSVYPGDAAGMHFGLFDGTRLVTVVTAHPEQFPSFADEGQWRIRGMATEEGYQGKGLGVQVLRTLLNWAREKGIPLFWCNAREPAIPFYAREGFTVESEIFEVPNCGPHKVMRKIL